MDLQRAIEKTREFSESLTDLSAEEREVARRLSMEIISMFNNDQRIWEAINAGMIRERVVSSAAAIATKFLHEVATDKPEGGPDFSDRLR